MKNYKANKKYTQKNIKAGRDANVVSGNYTKTTNINIWLMLIGVIAAGAMAVLGIKVFNNFIELRIEDKQQQQPPTFPSPTSKSLKSFIDNDKEIQSRQR